MADIDDELLALAGGDSDSEGSVRNSRDRSESPPRRKRGAARGKRSGGRGNDSEEEGEASDADSLESAPMDESDSDDDGAGGDDENIYHIDGLFKSEAEKAQIMGLRDLEREQILADRQSEIERLKQNRLLRQMVTEKERKDKKKRSADSADLEDDSRRTSRQRTGKESAMDSLRRARAEKQKRKEGKSHRRDDFSPERGAYSDDEESDFEYGRRRSRTPEKEEAKEQPPAELKDFERVRLGRNEFAQVCFTPGFEASITGCFIRVALGPHPETGIEQYRMAMIKGFTTSRPYALSGPNGSFVTDQYVKAAHGKAIKEFPFIAASSGTFSESELNRYQVTCHNEGVKLPTKPFLTDKIDNINSLINHNWTNEEIKARLTRRNELKKRFDPAERERVARLLEEATVADDTQKMEELQEELDKMGAQRLAFKTSLGPAKSNSSLKTSSEQDRLAERNKENRRLNAEAVRKAQLKERAKAREMEKALTRGEQVTEDPSRRLRTKAKFVHDVNDQAGKGSENGTATNTPTNGTPTVTATKPGGVLPHIAKLQSEDTKGLPIIHKPLVDDDVIGSLDLDIDVEI